MKSITTHTPKIASSNLMVFGILMQLVLYPSTDAQELKKVRMGCTAFSLTFLTFFVAKDAGIYKKHGLDVDMSSWPAPCKHRLWSQARSTT